MQDAVAGFLFTEIEMGMHVVLVGNPVDGFQVVGPFKTAEDAVFWAEDTLDGEWCTAPLEAQEDWD